MPKIKDTPVQTTVEFGLQWKGADGKWRSETFDYIGAREHRQSVEASKGGTEFDVFTRDRTTTYTPWKKRDRE